MEVSCPTCTQRLRYPDHLANPLLRCKTCQTTFRPGDRRSTTREPVLAESVERVDELEEWSAPEVDARETAASRSKAYQLGAKGLGSFGLIIVLLGIKVVPRIMREVFREKNPPPPVQMRDDERRAVEKLLRDAQEDAKRLRDQRRLPQHVPPPEP